MKRIVWALIIALSAHDEEGAALPSNVDWKDAFAVPA